MLNSVSSTTGSTQPGLRTMSSKVVFGEKNTPTTRPTGLIAGCDCASGAGMDVVVAIEVPPHRGAVTGAFPPRSTPHYARTPHKLSGGATAAFYGVRQQHSRHCRARHCRARAEPHRLLRPCRPSLQRQRAPVAFSVTERPAALRPACP